MGLVGKQLSAKLPHKKLGPKAMTDAIWMIESEIYFFYLSMNVSVLARHSLSRPLKSIAAGVRFSRLSPHKTMLIMFEACLYTRHAYPIDTHV